MPAEGEGTAVLRLAAGVVVMGLALAAVSHAAEEEVLRAPSMEPLYTVDPEYPPAALRFGIQGTVRFEALIGEDGHIAFQKKSKRGIATSRRDTDLVRHRLAEAERLHRERQN